eukprot:801962-Prymnesium_polylepis.1
MARTKPFTKRPRIPGAPRVDRKAAARRAAHMASPEHRHQATHAFTLRGGRLAAAQIVKIKRTENRPHAMRPGCGSTHGLGQGAGVADVAAGRSVDRAARPGGAAAGGAHFGARAHLALLQHRRRRRHARRLGIRPRSQRHR